MAEQVPPSLGSIPQRPPPAHPSPSRVRGGSLVWLAQVRAKRGPARARRRETEWPLPGFPPGLPRLAQLRAGSSSESLDTAGVDSLDEDFG